MRTLSHTILLILFVSLAVFSQEPVPSGRPTATPDDNDVVKISTNLIQIDVTVTDKNGKPVTDLKPDEVEIYENAKLQKVTNFSFVNNGQTKLIKNDKKLSKDQILLPPPPIRPESVRRTIALVVDDLSLSFGETAAARDALRHFVNDQMQDGDLVAILRTGSGIGALQQFTTDKRMLLAAVDKVKFNMSGSMRLGTFNPIQPTLNEQLNGTRNQQGQTRNRAADIASERDYENEASAFRESVFASGSLGAINYVIRGMNDLPGRKSIIFLSSGLRLYVRDSRGVTQQSRIYDSLRRLVDLANRASVVFYTIDVRGVVAEGLTAEDDVNGLTSDQISDRLRERSDDLRDSQEGLTYLAKETGGFPYFLNNIGNGIRKVMEDQSYYLVGYEPNESTFDPKNMRFNSLIVQVKRPGVKVRFRRGFYGFSEEQVQLALDKTPATQKLYNALTSPFSVNDISLRMNSVFITDSKRNSYMRSFLHVDPTNLTFTSPGPNSHKTTFDVLAATFGDQGIPVDGFRTSFTLDLSDEAYKKAQQKGLVYDFDFPIKKAGAYQMRIAIRDAASNKVGSANQFVQVPNLNKNRLTLSGVLVNTVSLDTWNKLDTMKPEEALKVLNPKSDTALRQFTVGNVLSYETTVYNAKRDASGNTGLTVQAKLYRDLDVVFEGKPAAIPLSGTSSDIVAKGSLMLGADLVGGNYTLQVIVTDNTGEKPRVAFQFLPFEIIR